jgi:hypothetical protein
MGGAGGTGGAGAGVGGAGWPWQRDFAFTARFCGAMVRSWEPVSGILEKSSHYISEGRTEEFWLVQKLLTYYVSGIHVWHIAVTRCYIKNQTIKGQLPRGFASADAFWQ